MNAFRLATKRLSRGAPGRRSVEGAGRSSREADDAALIADVIAGKPERAAAFCQRVWRPVDRTVRRLLGRDDNDFEDLVQLAVIELIHSVGNFRGDGSLDSWVSAVTAHVVYRQIRRRGMDRLVPIEAIDEQAQEASSSTGESGLAERQTLARVVRHLERIGEKLAWAFLLHDVFGYGLRDVAQIVGSSEAAAQSRLVRGRRRLHELIAADPDLADLRDGLPRDDDDDDQDREP